jgi:S-DNA-T family DNA segregation ATPase FtsK/SpoIIIE
MARKASDLTELPHRGIHDVIGIVLCFAALLIFVALLSYDPHDSSAIFVPHNPTPHNWGGNRGAETAFLLFQALGVAAYIVPPMLIVFGLGYIFRFLSYLRRCWVWGALLLVCCMGLLSTFESDVPLLTRVRVNLNTASVGGMMGKLFHQYILSEFGKIGAAIVLGALYVISLLYLTNFRLGEVCRRWWADRVAARKLAAEEEEEKSEKSDKSDKYEKPEKEEKPGGKKGGAATAEELERRKKELEEQTRKLQEQLDKARKAESEESEAEAESGKSGLGPDLQPVPEPMVRDLSVPQPKPKKAPSEKSASAKDGENASGREVAAATTAEILGRPSEASGKTSTRDVSERDPSREDSKSAEEKDAAEPKPATGPQPLAVPDSESESDSDADAEVESEADSESEPQPVAVVAPKPRLQARKPKPIVVAATPKIGDYHLPPIDLLQYPDTSIKPTETREELMKNARLMQQTLAQFDIDVALGDITKGPTITRYELHPAPGVKLEKIVNLTNNIAAALKAERINVLAPIPGKSSVGVEVPNAVKTKVIMRDLFDTDEWKNTKCRIPLALGKDVYGQPIIADLAEMPHLLIAGSTGSGKSVCINSIIASLLYKFSPDKLRFVMIDPKVVELQQYNALPHLVVPVVTDPKKVILALRWVVSEMEKRYQIFARVGVRNIRSFNERPKNKPLPKHEPELPLTSRKDKTETNSEGFAVELDEDIVVPRDEDIVIPDFLSYIVVIIDELADLMLVAPSDVEMAIARITQMARAAGIHCIVATQRPSVDVITGVIKANIPARIAFQVAAKVDSRTILDAMGADKLLGKGDMLYLPPGSAKLIRAQGVLVTDQEIQSIVDFISTQAKPSYELEIHQQLQKLTNSMSLESEGGGSDEDEDLIQQCIEVIRSEQKASVSLLQRRLRLGYTRAARIMDEIEDRGIVGPSKGAEPRDILIDLDGEGADGRGVDTGSKGPV